MDLPSLLYSIHDRVSQNFYFFLNIIRHVNRFHQFCVYLYICKKNNTIKLPPLKTITFCRWGLSLPSYSPHPSPKCITNYTSITTSAPLCRFCHWGISATSLLRVVKCPIFKTTASKHFRPKTIP